MSANRAEIRSFLRSVLHAALVPADCAAVYAYPKASFGSKTPVICIASGGSNRSKAAFKAERGSFSILVHVYVLYGSKDDKNWTEEDAEERLDLLECKIAEALAAVPDNNGVWSAIGPDGDSQCLYVDISGNYYRRETIPLRVEVY